MLVLFIIAVFSSIVVLINNLNFVDCIRDKIVPKKKIFFTFVFFCILYFVIAIDFNKTDKKNIKIKKYNIYSLQDDIGEIDTRFIIGSRYVDSSNGYSFFIKNKDSSKEKMFIPSAKTKFFEGYNTPFYEEIKCEDGYKFNYLKGWYEVSEPCLQNLERKLFVPDKTIILEYKI